MTAGPAALLARGVTVGDVETALAKTNEINSVGHYEQSFLRYQILVSGLFTGAQDIANVTVAVKNRVPVTSGQLGTVGPGFEPRTVETSGNGRDSRTDQRHQAAFGQHRAGRRRHQAGL